MGPGLKKPQKEKSQAPLYKTNILKYTTSILKEMTALGVNDGLAVAVRQPEAVQGVDRDI